MSESNALDLAQHFRRNATTEINTTGGHGFQGHVTRFCTQTAEEDFNSLDAHRKETALRVVRDDDADVACFHLRGNFRKLLAPARVAQKFVDILNAHPGGEALVAHVAVL